MHACSGDHVTELDTAMIIKEQYRILGAGLELACNGGSCRRILLKRDHCHLQASSSPIPGIRKRSIYSAKSFGPGVHVW